MNRGISRRHTIIATIMMMLSTTMLFASLPSQTIATPTTITTITPDSGPVGTIVRVIGEIDTENGSYRILWDRKSVKEWKCVGKAVNDTFKVPPSATGSHNATLYDIANLTESSPQLFTVTTSYYVLAEPARIQEGLNTSIIVGVNGAEANTTYTLTVNVTDPQPVLKTYNTTLIISTNATGSGTNSTLYPGSFSVGANTNYVGTYTIAVLADNETLATGNFTVRLTDKLEYKRLEKVFIRGSGYDSNENVTINITIAGMPVAGYPKNVTANTDGVVDDLWEIPVNASTGVHTVTLTNATTPGTVKTPTDTQNFTVVATILTVTITDQPQALYKRTETALVKFNITYPDGALYNATHFGTITVTVYYNTTFVANVSLTEANYEQVTGKWNCMWKFPKDAVLGTGYNFAILKNAVVDKFGNTGPPTNMSSTTFMVSRASFTSQIKTVNLANEAMANITVEVYNATTNKSPIFTKKTNTSGWAEFLLELGNYTFKAFWMNVTVSVLRNQSIEENRTLILECQLAHIEITVRDEIKKQLLPFINITLMYNYTTRYNQTISEANSVQTDHTGTVKLFNIFANISYIIEARRYGFLFNTTPVESLTQPWNKITIIAPTYTAFVQVVDSKGSPAEQGVQVTAYEWMSGTGEPAQFSTTDSEGKVTLALTFGRYRLRVYKGKTLLNETIIDLIQNQSFLIYCKIYNVDLTVAVTDYFGQPIPNALVTIEWKVNLTYIKAHESQTGSNGYASFNGIIGGDSRISVFVGGNPVETRLTYLEGTKSIVIRVEKYVTIFGYPIGTSQLVTFIILSLLILSLALVLSRKRLSGVFKRKMKAP